MKAMSSPGDPGGGSTRPLGLGLLGGGAAILVLLLLWLFVSGAQGGGIVLGLILAVILAGPLLGAGGYILSRQSVETASAAALAARRQVLDSDRLFRAETGEALRRLADRSLVGGDDLRALADDLQGGEHRGVAWEQQVQLDASGMARLGQYDDLVRQRVRQLRDAPPDGVPTQAIRELRQALDQREDLLLLGRQAPALDPALLLRSGDRPTEAADLEQLRVGDAVSSDAANYVAESVAAYFAEGQTWKLVRLAPTVAGTRVIWLYVGPGGLEVATLDEVPAAGADAQAPSMPGAEWAEAGSGTAVVDITGVAGSAQGVLVSYRRYRDPRHLSMVERWPDGATHAYAGGLIQPGTLQVWPAARPTT